MNWRSRCTRGGRLRDKTVFLRPHDPSAPDAFFDEGTHRRADGNGYRLRFTLRPA